METFVQIAYLIFLLPLVVSTLAFLWKNQLGRRVGDISVATMVLCVILALGAFWNTIHAHDPFNYSFRWATLGNLDLTMGFMVDQLTALMLVIVTVVSLLVQIYSRGYMAEDERYPTYFAFLTFFSGSMLGLVLSNNLLQMFVFWELVGVSSYLLIGFWYQKKSAADAAKKAFIVTKIGDLGFIAGLAALYVYSGNLEFSAIFATLSSIAPEVLTVIALLLFLGAVGKSAQFPLHIWLPNAMEGPTPVSALIHAATMVVAGIFMVARMYPLFDAAPHALEVVAIVGAITALFAATIAIVQTDIKAVLAYSTISQLGYMIAGLGVGAYTASLFHLTTHAFFKALLFLGAGSVIHSLHTQDMREMGGLHSKMHKTFLTFLIGALCLAGIPPFSGFFSKDEILTGAVHHPLIFWMLIAGAFITAFYVTRQVIMIFLGEPRDHHKHDHAHESHNVMAVPLEILAVLSVLIGLVGLPGISLFGGFIHYGHGAHDIRIDVMLLSTFVALAGVGLGWLVYGKKSISAEKMANTFKPIYTLLDRRYYIDEFYQATIVRLMVGLSKLARLIDVYVIDGIVNLVGRGFYLISHLARLFDEYVIDALVNLVGIVIKKMGWLFRFSQTGYVQNYLVVVLIGIIVLVSAGILGVLVL